MTISSGVLLTESGIILQDDDVFRLRRGSGEHHGDKGQEQLEHGLLYSREQWTANSER